MVFRYIYWDHQFRYSQEDGQTQQDNIEEFRQRMEAAFDSEFSGREHILFLGPPVDLSSEVWRFLGYWDVQRSEGGTAMAIHPNRDLWRLLDPDGYQTHQSSLEMELSALTQAVTTAHEARVAEFDGRIGADADLPMLVSSVNQLRQYYTDVGAYDPGVPPPVQPPPPCGLAVADQTANMELKHDCFTLLTAKDTLVGRAATLNWSPDLAIADWDGITIGGDPVRVTRLELPGNSLTGSIPAYLGNLLGITHLDLSNNQLTGAIPMELSWLVNLEEIRLSGNSLTGCIPVALEDVATNDLDSLGLLYCQPPSPENLATLTPGEASVRLSWDLMSDVTKFRAEYRIDQPYGYWATGDEAITADTHLVVGLLCETDYLFQVSAYGSGTHYATAWSEPSTMIEATTGACVAPVFDASSYTFAVAQGAAIHDVVGSVSVSDSPGDRASYEITAGNDDNVYAVGNTGEITVAGEIDEHTASPTVLTVEVSDLGGGTDQTTVTIVTIPSHSGLTVAPSGDHQFNLSWEPVTLADNYKVRYSETGQESWTEVDAEGKSQLSISTLPCDRTHEFQVAAVVYGTRGPYSEPPVEASCNIAPEFDQPSYLFTVKDDAASGYVLGQVSASDAEGESLTYSIASGDDLGHFGIASESGVTQVTVAGTLDYTAQAHYTLTLEVRDGNNGTSTTTAQVFVGDVLQPELTCLNGGSVPAPELNTGLVRDCTILLEIKDTLAGSATLNWAGNIFIGFWDGITLDFYPRRVARLMLTDKGLDGSIPLLLGELEELDRIDLDENQLTGTIPSELGNLTKLRIVYLLNNDLDGSIPDEFSKLARLEILSLSGNDLTGGIPVGLGGLSRMIELNLADNDLSGTIPAELGNLTKLRDLWLNNNDFTGEIPAGFGDLTKLRTLALSRNQLTGGIPEGLGQTSLRTLYLDQNGLSGPIPSQLGDLADLVILSLYANELDGEIPATLGDLEDLIHLFLSDNQLTGPIPASLGNLGSLTELRLEGNNLSGSIPRELEGITTLRTLYVSGNNLSGCIPVGLKGIRNNDLSRLDLEDCVNPAPAFGETSYSFTVAEDAALRDVVGTLSASDYEGESVTYAISQGNGAGSFQIDSESGEIAVAGNLDYETKASYSLKIQATDDEGATSEVTVAIEVTDVDEPPPAPNAPSVTVPTTGGDTSLEVTWTASITSGIPAISSYDLRHILASADDSADSNWTVVTAAWTTGALKYTLTGLDSSSGYKVQVRGINDEGTGPWSSSGEGTTEALQPPAVPSNLTATSTHDSVTLSWDSPADSTVSGYQILRKLLGEPDLEVHVADTGSTNTEFTDTGLDPETTYVYRVKAINLAGVGPSSNFVRIETNPSP